MLKYLREKMKLTQAELAALVGVSESYIYKIESGKREPSVPTARKIGKVFGVCYKVLLGCPDKECDNCQSNRRVVKRKKIKEP